MTPAEAEAKRIRAEYERREREIGRDFYALTSPPNLFTRHGQERALLRGLARADALPLGDKRILEVGCGRGQWFSVLEDFGARRERLAGIDLDPGRIGEAQQRYAGADLRVGDATQLPWENCTFDVVFQSTVFSSILDPSVRRAVADQMMRVVRPTGVIVWYDLRYDNPRNRHVRGISAHEIRLLFGRFTVDLESVTLATPLARTLVARSWLAAAIIERLGVANTHYLGVARPP
jgi:SAM-dependent methyltransferase